MYVPKDFLKMPTLESVCPHHKAASVTLLEEINDKVTVIMLQNIKKWGNEEDRYDATWAFPAGKIADKRWDNPKMVEMEPGNPLLTAARELSEECAFAFSSLDDAWKFLNSDETAVVTNQNWKFYPVVEYMRPLTPALSKKFDAAIQYPSLCKAGEIAAVTRVPLSSIQEAFKQADWTEEGFDARSQRIAEAKKRGEQADLTQFAQYDRNLEITDLYGKKILVAPYAARSLFTDIDTIETVADMMTILREPLKRSS